MRPDQAIKRVRAWHTGKPIPAHSTRHFAIADDEDLLIVAFVRMGGESAPWGIAWGHPGEDPSLLTVPEARNRESVATMIAQFAPLLLEHFWSPHTRDWDGARERDKSIPLRQLWMPNGSHVDMLHFLAYSYSFTKFGPRERYLLLNALGRLAGWLFREHDRPGQMTVMPATDALRDTYVFPAEDIRQAHLGYLMAWLETSGGREKRLNAAQEAESHSISISIDPAVEREMLNPLVDQWNDTRLGSRVREKAKAEIAKVLEGELRARYELVQRSIAHLRAKGPRENRGVASLTDASSEEHWYQYLRLELRVDDEYDGQAFTPSPETDRAPAAAASRYLIQQASEEFRVAALIHDDEEMQREALASGDGIRGQCVKVRNLGDGNSIQAVWTLDVPEIAPLHIREGSTLCPVGCPKRTLRVESVDRIEHDLLRVEVLVIGAKKAFIDENRRAHPIANSPAFKGKEMTLVPASMHQIPRLKTKKIWNKDVPGGWITHAPPAGPKAKLPEDAAGEDENLFEKLGRL